MDLLMKHDSAKEYVRVFGIEKFVDMLEDSYKGRFYSCSDYWISDPKYVCKLKGANRDLIIGWYGVHDR